ncbi:MAG: glycoside hydrolase family 2 protein, partial [Victivallales bacterium]|nr:glycoside hydrolase family 2 protein [Victivallales bacterium]
IYINDQEVCGCSNAYAAYRPEIKRHLKCGINRIRLSFKPIDEEAKRVAETRGGNFPHSEDCLVKHLNQVRKPICSGGWDWGITLATCGVYDPIRIVGRQNVSIRSIYTTQKHEGNRVKVTAVAEVTAERSGTERVTFSFNGETRGVTADVVPGDNLVKAEFEVHSPRLWWPNGFGSPELYTLTVKSAEETLARNIGLRTIEVINEADEYGTSLKFRINGIDIFAKGADWIPCDAMPSGQTPERYENLLESARLANMNMIRVWGGGQYERECFYEICDAKGLLVWQDMMFAVAIYPADDIFAADVAMELDYQIRRLRHHASLAMWCGDNECIGCLSWLPEERPERIASYKKLNAVLAAKVAELDPERTFWPSSPCGGPGNFKDGWHNDKDGDMHYWEVWHGGKDFSAYYSIKPRFCSEFGYQSFPSLETVGTFCPEDEYDVLSPTMQHHQKCRLGNQPILKMFSKYFREPKGFDNFLYLSQVQQALAIKTGVEFWRTTRPRCMGTLFWQFNDNWPVASWASVEFGGKWKLLQYEAKRFYSQVIAVMLKEEDGSYALYAVNDLPEACDAEVIEECRHLTGGKVFTRTHHAALQAGESRLLARYDSAYCPEATPAEHFIELRTTAVAAASRQEFTHRNTFFFAPFHAMELPEAVISVDITDNNGVKCITLISSATALFAVLDAPGLSGIFSDNNFTLLPDERKVLFFHSQQPCTCEELREKLTICHLRQSYGEM